jgi:hypothetical protein
MSAITSVAGAIAGAGLMYVLDPVAGARRRSIARDKLAQLRRQGTRAAATVGRDALNRGRGTWATVTGWQAPADVSDGVMEDRIRAELGRLVRYPRLVGVRSEGGHVLLSGVVAGDEIRRLVHRIRRMRGVRRVDNLLQECADPADLPGAQRPVPARPTAPSLGLMQKRWSPSVRAGSATIAGGLLVDGVRRGGISGLVLAAAGAVVLLRALANRPLTRGAREESWTDRSR